MEKFIQRALLNDMTDNMFMWIINMDFVHGRSCITQLLAVLDNWTEILDQEGEIDAIYLDIAEAFDKVPHQCLLAKLQRYGVKGKILQ
jgi:hypothetical protein